MKTTDENIELSRPVTLRVLQIMDIVLSKPAIYKVPSIRAFAHSLKLESTHIYAMRDDENRNVTLVTCIRVCMLYGFSANWLLLEKGGMKMLKSKEERTIEERLSALEIEVKTVIKKKK